VAEMTGYLAFVQLNSKCKPFLLCLKNGNVKYVEETSTNLICGAIGTMILANRDSTFQFW
jgi:hypothetical protein